MPAFVRPIWQGFARRMLIAVLVVGMAYLLLSEHRAHLLGWLPFLLLLACPFLHLTMHGGHGADRPPAGSGDERPPPHAH